jgi:hypothetical protein
MKVFIANFGIANKLWPVCRERSTVATINDDDLHALWLAGDRDGYIECCVTTKKTAAGITPTRPVASRWFNLAGIVCATESDIWIHREKEALWWTTSLPGEATFSHQDSSPGPVYMIHKAATPWTDRSKAGAPLRWSALHARAREFLFTEGTLQQISEDHARYAVALISGESLDQWHSRPDWRAKSEKAGRGAATVFSPRQRAVTLMVMTALGTVAGANGQEVLRTVKAKECLFRSPKEFEAYVEDLLTAQEGLCALTGLPLGYGGEDEEDPELRCSLDRIDSDGHYASGNLQVVCRFANRWKNDGSNATFRRLIQRVRAEGA